jgi:hypothetical protein
MPDPIGTKCGTRSFDSSECKEKDYPACADLEAKGAALETLTLSRGKLAVIDEGNKRRQFVPPFYLIRRIDSIFWLGHPGASGVCRAPHEKAPNITKSWNLYSMPSTVQPIASTPSAPESSPEMEAIKDAAGPVLLEFFKPFERAYKEFVRGDYKAAADELGTEQRVAMGIVAGLALLGTVVISAKRRARKRREVISREQELERGRKTTLESEAISSPPISYNPDRKLNGSEQTVGIDQILREDGLDTRLSGVYSGRGTMPSPGTDMGRFSTLPSVVGEPSYVESLSRAAWMTPEHGPLVVEALQSLEGDVGGMTVRESYEQGIGIEIPTRIWKMATLIALRFYGHSNEDLGGTIGRIVAGAATKAGKGRAFGVVEMVMAAEKLSGVKIDQDDASKAIFPYREWVVDEDAVEPYANKTVRTIDDSDLPPFGREMMREFEKMRESGRAFIPREEALRLLQSEDGKRFIEEAEIRYGSLPEVERARMSLAEYVAVAAVMKGRVEDARSTPVKGSVREEERREERPGRTRRDVMLPEASPMDTLRETVGKAKK